MYDKERDLFGAFAAKRLSRRELFERTGKLGDAARTGLLDALRRLAAGVALPPAPATPPA